MTPSLVACCPHCGEPYLPPNQLRALVAQESTAENSQEVTP